MWCTHYYAWTEWEDMYCVQTECQRPTVGIYAYMRTWENISCSCQINLLNYVSLSLLWLWCLKFRTTENISSDNTSRNPTTHCEPYVLFTWRDRHQHWYWNTISICVLITAQRCSRSNNYPDNSSYCVLFRWMFLARSTSSLMTFVRFPFRGGIHSVAF